MLQKNHERNYFLQLHCLFHPSESTIFFSLEHVLKKPEMVENPIKLIDFVTFFSDVMILLYFCFFN